VRIRGYPEGSPCWVDVSSPDLEAAKAFYSRLFGWTAVVSDDPAAGGYTHFQCDGRAVAGLGPPAHPQQSPAWLTYVASDDLDQTGKSLRAAGGEVLMAPVPIAEQGRMALFADPAGAMFAGWQRGRFYGAQAGNEPNTSCWTELSTCDIDGARAFYRAVFGWQDGPGDLEQFSYEWQLGERTIAGLAPSPPESDPQWTVCFMVEDCPATVARAVELGGRALMAPVEVSVGLYGRLADPHGATFSVISLVPAILAALL
jgi:predicted enzyme related to lactoylglutathione lyase